MNTLKLQDLATALEIASKALWTAEAAGEEINRLNAVIAEKDTRIAELAKQVFDHAKGEGNNPPIPFPQKNEG